MGQVAKGLQSLAEREDKLTYEWQEWRRRNEMRRIGEQTAQEARQREERRRSWKEVAAMAAELSGNHANDAKDTGMVRSETGGMQGTVKKE